MLIKFWTLVSIFISLMTHWLAWISEAEDPSGLSCKCSTISRDVGLKNVFQSGNVIAELCSRGQRKKWMASQSRVRVVGQWRHYQGLTSRSWKMRRPRRDGGMFRWRKGDSLVLATEDAREGGKEEWVSQPGWGGVWSGAGGTWRRERRPGRRGVGVRLRRPHFTITVMGF